MLLYFTLIGVTIFIIVVYGKAAIEAIIDYHRLPKPPKDYTWNERYDYYHNKRYLEEEEADAPLEIDLRSIFDETDDPDFDKFEEIREYKRLFEEGIISEEEFIEKKKQLLEL